VCGQNGTGICPWSPSLSAAAPTKKSSFCSAYYTHCIILPAQFGSETSYRGPYSKSLPVGVALRPRGHYSSLRKKREWLSLEAHTPTMARVPQPTMPRANIELWATYHREVLRDATIRRGQISPPYRYHATAC
jgi:hypothetical protein